MIHTHVNLLFVTLINTWDNSLMDKVYFRSLWVLVHDRAILCFMECWHYGRSVALRETTHLSPEWRAERMGLGLNYPCQVLTQKTQWHLMKLNLLKALLLPNSTNLRFVTWGSGNRCRLNYINMHCLQGRRRCSTYWFSLIRGVNQCLVNTNGAPNGPLFQICLHKEILMGWGLSQTKRRNEDL